MDGVRDVFLGFDGGGTKCAGCAVYNDENFTVFSTFTVNRSSNHNSVGWEAAEDSFRSTVEGLKLSSGNVRVKGVCLGMAGVSNAQVAEKWAIVAEKLFGIEKSNVRVFNDAVIALASGTDSVLKGVVVISGTGTITYGRNGDECNFKS